MLSDFPLDMIMGFQIPLDKDGPVGLHGSMN